jgi:hypothetical protein
MPTTFSTDALIGVVESLLSPPQWALDRYFRTINQSDSETINFDLILGRRRVAPFCSPLVAGKVVGAGPPGEHLSARVHQGQAPHQPRRGLEARRR